MEQIIQLTKPAIAGSKQKIELRQLPFFEKSVKTTQKAPTSRQVSTGIQSVSQKHLAEVKNIFDKVDEVFKRRKEECILLVWQIADLQNELAQLESTTNSYAERAAGKGTVLSWMITEMKSLEVDLADLQNNFVDPTCTELNYTKEIFVKGIEIIETFDKEVAFASSQCTKVDEQISEASQFLLPIANDLLSFGDLCDSLKEISLKFSILISNAELKVKEFTTLVAAATTKHSEITERNLMSKEEIIQKQFENTMQDEQIDQMKTMLANMEFKLHSEINEKNFELQSMKSEILNTEIRDLQLKQIADEQDEEIRRLIEILSSLNDKTANLKVKLQHQISANDKMEDEIVDMEHQIEYTEMEIDNKNERLTKARHELLEQKLINEERRKAHEIHCNQTRAKLDELHYFLSIDAKIRFDLNKAKSQLQMLMEKKIQENKLIQEEIMMLKSEYDSMLIEKEKISSQNLHAAEQCRLADKYTLSLERELEVITAEKEALTLEKKVLQETERQRDQLEKVTNAVEIIDLDFVKAIETQDALRKMQKEQNLLLNEMKKPIDEFESIENLTEEEIAQLEDEVQRESAAALEQIDQQFNSEKLMIQQAIQSIQSRMEKGMPDNPALVAEIEAIEQQINQARSAAKYNIAEDTETKNQMASTTKKPILSTSEASKSFKDTNKHQGNKENISSMEDWFNDTSDFF